MKNLLINRKRGISSLVGAMIFVVLMIAAFSVMGLALNTQSDMVSTQRLVSDNDLKKQQERLSVSASTDQNNHLQVYVNNKGQNPTEIASIWIINKTASGEPAARYEIDPLNSYIPSGYGSQILSGIQLQMNTGTYDIKTVSKLGNIEKTELKISQNGLSQSVLRTELFTTPTDISVGQNVTLAMLVTNSGLEKIFNVTASIPKISPSNLVVNPLPNNPSMVDLSPSESILFTWDYKLGTAVGVGTFSNNATGKLSGNLISSNTITDKIIVHESNNELDVINKELISRPEIFIIKPSPFGDSDNKGIWGVNIVNPTNQPMEVSKITISLVSPRAQSNDLIFDPTGGVAYCAPDSVSPTTNYWSCQSANQLMWKNTSTPIVIPPISVYSFLAKVKPGSLAGSSVDLESIIVHVSVFTNVGEFGKAGYGSSLRNNGDTLTNVFLAKNPRSTSNTDIQASRTGIVSGSLQTFNISLSDLDLSSNYIQSGSKLIINIPKGWSSVQVLDHTGFNTPNILTFSDGSSQITSSLTSNLSNGAQTIQFSAVAPTVTNPQLYVMYVLADGETGNNFAIGPLSEVLLQVCPTSGCP